MSIGDFDMRVLVLSGVRVPQGRVSMIGGRSRLPWVTDQPPVITGTTKHAHAVCKIILEIIEVLSISVIIMVK